MGNCDPYSDSPEPAVVEQPQSTRVEEPTLLCNQVAPSTFLGDTEYTLTRPFIRRLPCPAMSSIAKIARSHLS
jgi:hypothetical protein